ncbi:MAG: putative toxin-antitoxin system toxin component, PIN family [Dehalococcoidaceae bacterium]|nr:putative toxin-antitoxin system toxin component, PIN family [Dehalococcoidaceae bacterium]
MPAKPELRVFLDTNVIFSGLYSAKGAPGTILDHYVQGKFKVVVSRQVLDELVYTLKQKLPHALPALRTFLINMPPEVTPDPPLAEIRRWNALQPGDAAILAAAITAKPDFFVTGDNHFLDNADALKQTGLNIVTPADFLKQVKL